MAVADEEHAQSPVAKVQVTSTLEVGTAVGVIVGDTGIWALAGASSTAYHVFAAVPAPMAPSTTLRTLRRETGPTAACATSSKRKPFMSLLPACHESCTPGLAAFCDHPG